MKIYTKEMNNKNKKNKKKKKKFQQSGKIPKNRIVIVMIQVKLVVQKNPKVYPKKRTQKVII